MKTTKQAMDKMNVIPRLRRAERLETGGVKSTGPHRVKFISDKLVMGKDPETMKERQEIQFTVEENGVQKIWNVPLFNKKGEPNYLIERLADIKEGDEVILESKRRGPKNYTSVQRLSHPTEVEADDDEGNDGDPSILDESVELAEAVAKFDSESKSEPPF